MLAFLSHLSHCIQRAPRVTGAVSFAALVALAPSLGGCEVVVAMAIADEAGNKTPPPDPTYDSNYGNDGTSQMALQVSNATVQGDLGDVSGFAGVPQDIDAEDYGNGDINVTFWLDGYSTDKWATMTALTFTTSGLSKPLFTPGSTFHFSADDYQYDSSGAYVSAYGCSGTGEYADDLTYEMNGAEVDLAVSEAEKPGMVHMAFTISYPGNLTPQIVQGSFDIAVPQD